MKTDASLVRADDLAADVDDLAVDAIEIVIVTETKPPYPKAQIAAQDRVGAMTKTMMVTTKAVAVVAVDVGVNAVIARVTMIAMRLLHHREDRMTVLAKADVVDVTGTAKPATTTIRIQAKSVLAKVGSQPGKTPSAA